MTGVASEVAIPSGSGLRDLRLEPWVPDDPDHFVRIESTLVSGRRISAGPAPQKPALGETDAGNVELALPEMDG